jgi:hypothetical protein
MQAKTPWVAAMRSVTSPPSRTRITSLVNGEAIQIAPSASRQQPSG